MFALVHFKPMPQDFKVVKCSLFTCLKKSTRFGYFICMPHKEAVFKPMHKNQRIKRFLTNLLPFTMSLYIINTWDLGRALKIV